MSDFHQRMAEIRQMQGKDPIRATTIEGFSASDPPPPMTRAPEVPSAAELYGEPAEDFEDLPVDPPPSPLVEAALRRTHLPEPSMPKVGVSVVDRQASINGRGILLSEDELNSIAETILRAIKRDLDAQFQAVLGHRIRRQRKTRRGKKP